LINNSTLDEIYCNFYLDEPKIITTTTGFVEAELFWANHLTERNREKWKK
jgi:hypothetical protein